MSREYMMQITIENWDRQRKFDVMTAAEEEGDFSIERYTTTRGEGECRTSLSGGESEEQYVDRVTRAIWVANRGFCKVRITCCCLEDPPAYERTEADYQRIKEWVDELIRQQQEEED